MKWGRNRGVQLVLLGVKPGNRRALTFYARYGFTRVEPEAGADERKSCCEQQVG
jgi:ribosomal protein S18 acetylase RimI-like enzyme